MGTIPQVLHTGARPIGLQEFADALRACCPPRFPNLTNFAGNMNIPRPVGMAISGGVDSMAMAYLCSRLRMQDRGFQLADNPVAVFRACVVDHRLREGSTEEAGKVAKALKVMGIHTEVVSLKWKETLLGTQYDHPKDLPNFESIARRLRYQKLARWCNNHDTVSLLLAHHEDDQYETVLMRLLLGHKFRGLRGMKKAADIPECEGLHKAYYSGWLDDQARDNPYWDSKISNRKWEWLRGRIRSQISDLMQDEEDNESLIAGLDPEVNELHPERRRVILDETIPPDSEDGGIMLYRPLLEFTKDRLVATCEANKVPWFEDSTNKDPTLTMRNAVRYMCKNYTLPVALQKPSVLALSRRCDDKAMSLEADAERLLKKTVIHELNLYAGTVTVQFPKTTSLSSRDLKTPRRRQARIQRQREVAALMIHRIQSLVSPNDGASTATILPFVSRLFPTRCTPDEPANSPPKAFAIGGTHFVPVMPKFNARRPRNSSRPALTWYISRAPYPSNVPVPRWRSKYWEYCRWPGKWQARRKWPEWSRWQLWDGRYWLSLRHRFPHRIVLQPFEKEHAKRFRDKLHSDDADRLAALLKRHAPGKVRYTLPALYIEEELNLGDIQPRPLYPIHTSELTEFTDAIRENGDLKGDGLGNRILTNGVGLVVSDHPKIIDHSQLQLIALPTLGIQVPMLEDWLEYDVRYKRADRRTLAKAGSFKRGSFIPPKPSGKRRTRV
ncbi:adenine nucleotide alpha hydrolases-like protein [Xylariaceae sp. FL1019]|nr:adenine nucleotide alpha hydrolases-like protein [Xylariaceae sp. FL1019]